MNKYEKIANKAQKALGKNFYGGYREIINKQKAKQYMQEQEKLQEEQRKKKEEKTKVLEKLTILGQQNYLLNNLQSFQEIELRISQTLLDCKNYSVDDSISWEDYHHYKCRVIALAVIDFLLEKEQEEE